MSAYVASASAAGAAARYADPRAGTASSMSSVDPINYSIGARSEEPQFLFNQRPEQEKYPEPRRRRYAAYEEPVAFAHAYVSREVGAGLVQAQSEIDFETVTPIQAKRGIGVYEANVRLLTPPSLQDLALPVR